MNHAVNEKSRFHINIAESIEKRGEKCFRVIFIVLTLWPFLENISGIKFERFLKTSQKENQMFFAK